MSPCAVLFCSFVNYFDYHIAYNEAVVLWYVPLHLKFLRQAFSIKEGPEGCNTKVGFSLLGGISIALLFQKFFQMIAWIYLVLMLQENVHIL